MSNSHDQFASTESYYARYRPGYGKWAIGQLCDRFEVDESTRVLDLGCGSGQIALALAEHAGTVVGMDPNKRMLEEARATALERGQQNVEWVVGSDAELCETMGPFDLTTMGRSFHWMDQQQTLERLYRMTVPGGALALLSDTEWFTRGTQAWQDAVYDVAQAFVADLPERTGPVESYPNPWDELIAEFGFVGVETDVHEFEREWTPEEIVGYCFSLSFCSPATVGETEAFEAAVRERLAEFDRDVFTHPARVRIISGTVTDR